MISVVLFSFPSSHNGILDTTTVVSIEPNGWLIARATEYVNHPLGSIPRLNTKS